MLDIVECLGLSCFASLQTYYTIAGHNLEHELTPTLQSEGFSLMVWSPLAGDPLSGKYRHNGEAETGGRRLTLDFPPVDKVCALGCIDVV